MATGLWYELTINELWHYLGKTRKIKFSMDYQENKHEILLPSRQIIYNRFQFIRKKAKKSDTIK